MDILHILRESMYHRGVQGTSMYIAVVYIKHGQ